MTFISSARQAFATSAPVAPRPSTPTVLPMSSGPAKFDFPFSTSAGILSPSPAMLFTHSMLPTTSREAMTMEHTVCSFTASALAPGLLKTTTPSSAYLSTGILL